MLFLCTGNYYRSRLAEAVFNFEAERAGIDWRATSRGLRTDLLDRNERKLRISPLTVAKLDELGIARRYTAKSPKQVTSKDMKRADCIVATSAREHRPYLKAAFAPLERWPLVYWDVDDTDKTRPEEALPVIVRQTRQLVADLKNGKLPKPCE